MRNKISVLYIIISVISFVVSSFLISSCDDRQINQKNMEKIFNEDYDLLSDITELFIDSEYEYIYISNNMNSGEMYVSGETVEIKSKLITNSIDALISKGYTVIEKSGNSIHFQRWSNLDSGYGVVFSIDESAPDIEYLTKFERLDKDNWYYYESDFNEWKLKK